LALFEPISSLCWPVAYSGQSPAQKSIEFGPLANIYFLASCQHASRMTEYPSRTADKIVVRLPTGMRDRLIQEAKANGRSVNAEVVNRLTSSFSDISGSAANPTLSPQDIAAVTGTMVHFMLMTPEEKDDYLKMAIERDTDILLDPLDVLRRRYPDPKGAK
jgi:predicted HicB family RNase H-like nuclease